MTTPTFDTKANRGRAMPSARALAFGRANLRCLAASIPIAACGFATGDMQPTLCRDNASGETFTAIRQEGAGNALVLVDTEGRRRIYTGSVSLTCVPAPQRRP
jgi:hypothetical protein